MSRHDAPLTPAYRYGIYLMPADAWHSLGSRWLGRNAWNGEQLARTGADEARIEAWTAAPRQYGLHATLKPPFRLAENETAAALDAALRELASTQHMFDLPLHLTSLRGFLAWCIHRPVSSDDAQHNDAESRLMDLANACVADLDRFRAPPSESETAKRRKQGLSSAQEANLARWAYPYVFDTFTFHITLTGRLADDEMEAAMTALAALATPDEAKALREGAAMPVRDIALFVQAAPEAPFSIARRYHFDGTVEDGVGNALLAVTR